MQLLLGDPERGNRHVSPPESSARLRGSLAVVTNAAVTACGIFGAYRLALARLVPAWRGATRAAGRPECGARVCGAVAAGAELAGLDS